MDPTAVCQPTVERTQPRPSMPTFGANDISGIAASPTAAPITVNGRRLPQRERALSLKMPVSGAANSEHSEPIPSMYPRNSSRPGASWLSLRASVKAIGTIIAMLPPKVAVTSNATVLRLTGCCGLLAVLGAAVSGSGGNGNATFHHRHLPHSSRNVRMLVPWLSVPEAALVAAHCIACRLGLMAFPPGNRLPFEEC